MPLPIALRDRALAVAALFVVPLAWVLSASLRQPGLPPPRTIEWLPDPIAWSNYARIFELLPLGTLSRQLAPGRRRSPCR